jgi:hypothetical protein
MSMSNYGSTRTPSLARGTPVLCLISKFLPERVSKRTGLKKPAENRSKVVSGTVLVDMGYTLYVKVRYASGATRDKSFFPHEVTVEADLMTYRNGLGG